MATHVAACSQSISCYFSVRWNLTCFANLGKICPGCWHFHLPLVKNEKNSGLLCYLKVGGEKFSPWENWMLDSNFPWPNCTNLAWPLSWLHFAPGKKMFVPWTGFALTHILSEYLRGPSRGFPGSSLADGLHPPLRDKSFFSFPTL